MDSRSGTRRSRRIGVALALALWPAAAWGTVEPVVQRIGDLSGDVAEAVLSEVVVVPFSPSNDPRATPFLLAPGKAFVVQGRDGQISGLTRAERRAIRQAYAAGQTITLLEASAHDVEALHVLLKDGVPHVSGAGPVALAYILRQESHVPTARVVTPLHPGLSAVDEPEAYDRAFQGAVEVVVAELSHPKEGDEDLPPQTTAGDIQWSDFPLQKTTFTSTSYGVYNTPVQVYALHACGPDVQTNIFYDYYLVDTQGDWTATEAKYQAASENKGELTLRQGNQLDIDWQDRAWNERDSSRCDGGLSVCRVFPCADWDTRVCRYANYPLDYHVELVPAPGPAVTQIDASPRGDQGRSESYSSGFSWSLGLSANVSKSGPSGSISAGVSWNNSVSSTVPPLAILAGDTAQQGAYTTYKYCTAGTTADCTSSIQMESAGGGLCQHWWVGDPQQGQTPDGKLSGVAQTALWRVDPATYVGDTFDVKVSWKVDVATSTSRLWSGMFDPPFPNPPGRGPTGYCNAYGCNCDIQTTTQSVVQEYTFKIPLPSKLCEITRP